MFHTARLATEKAVFRPALPMCSMPGMTEMHMARMSYAEQLKHPNWQRKRLEVLEHHDFSCRACSSKDKTLHVHHKQYAKGRMAWDYELSNFEALCEDCHKEIHDKKERFDAVLAQFPSDLYDFLADLLVGFGEDYVDPAEWLAADQEVAQAGRLAWHLHGNVKMGECFFAADAFMQLGPDRFIEVLKKAINEEFEG